MSDGGNWYEGERKKESSFYKEGPEYSSTRHKSSETGEEDAGMEKAGAMRMIKIRERSEFGDFLFEVIKVLAAIVEDQAQLSTFQRTIRESPDLGFQFKKKDDEGGDVLFRVDCDFEIANDYLKVVISGFDHEGNSFSGVVNMFLTDTLLKIGRRIAGTIPSHNLG